jgi:hypothetical protein
LEHNPRHSDSYSVRGSGSEAAIEPTKFGDLANFVCFCGWFAADYKVRIEERFCVRILG